MARISDDELERLRKEVSVERLAVARGIELKRHGADLIGRCPFHEDRTPSLVISPGRNLWHCLGACQTGGSAIDWVMKTEGVSFRHAVELLRSDLPAMGTSPTVVKATTVRKLPPPVSADADDRALLEQVVGYYHETLKQSPEALAYLESRGLRSPEMIDRFRLGFANRTLGLRIPMKNRMAGEELRHRLQRLGVLRESGHEHMNGSLVIPIFDESGAVVEMYGRKITPGLRPGTPLHLYLPGPHRGVWNREGLRASKTVILCEALIDALTFWQAGHHAVTAAYGIEGFTAEHVEVFSRLGVEQVLIAFDRDDAGDRGAEKAAATLIAAGMSCYRVQFPRGMDANEYAQKMSPPGKALDLLLHAAVLIGKGRKSGAMSLAVDPSPTSPVTSPPAEPAAPPPPPALTPEPPAVTDPLPRVSPGDAASSPSGGAERPPARPQASSAPAPQIAPVAASPSSLPSMAPLIPESTAPAAHPPSTIPCEIADGEIRFRFGDRRYRVRGFDKNTSFDVLKVNLLCAREDLFYVDTLDLYSARHRASYVKQAAVELGLEEAILKADTGKILQRLEQLQDEQMRAALTPQSPEVKVAAEDETAALALLRDPTLLERILDDFRRCGVVGEETNKLVGYLAAVSRKLEAPLAVVVQSSSAAGKSSLMEAVLAFMPEEDRVKYAAMTGQSLFYMGETNLKHKILAIVEEEGAARASYALKILQSEGELTIASTGKDPDTGKLITQEYRVEGPVMIFLTTTAIEIDEELLNRCLVLSVNEDREQTRAIHEMQRWSQTLEGVLARGSKKEILRLHQNAQRLLRALAVVNPYARELTFMDRQTRTRRDHMKYLGLIRTIALVHQHQRAVKTATRDGEEISYIEVALEDIAVANHLADQVLGRTLDELPPQTRRLLMLVDEHVTAECTRLAMERKDYRFTRREVREATGWGNTQLKIHLGRLEELEYLVVHRGGGRGQGIVYELAYEGKGKSGASFLSGLIDVERLGYDKKKSGLLVRWSGQEAKWSGPSRAEVGGGSGGSRGELSPAIPGKNQQNGHSRSKNAHLDETDSGSSYIDSVVPTDKVN